MGDVSKHFDRAEFKCKCGRCTYDTIDAELIAVLEDVREWADDMIFINSGQRCPEHNKKVGGSPNSQHVRGRAADIEVKGKTPFQVYRYLDEKYQYRYGLGRYDNFTHVDTRTGRARWKG